MKLAVALIGLVLVGCGSNGKDGEPGKEGTGGKPGTNGTNGTSGKDGINGTSGKDGINGTDGVYLPASTLALVVKQSESVLDIECVNTGFRGTGSKLANGQILTAFHVLDGCTSVQYFKGNVYIGGGGVLNRDGGRDIIRISSVNYNASGTAIVGLNEFKDYTPAVGDLTFTASLPLDLVNDVQVATGYVTDSSFTDGPEWTFGFITDAAAAGGSSGAPVFDSKGRLVGIHVGGFSTGGLELNIQILLR